MPKIPHGRKKVHYGEKGALRPGGFLMENSENQMEHFGKKGHYVDFAEDVKKLHFSTKSHIFDFPKAAFLTKSPFFSKRGILQEKATSLESRV